MGKNVISDEQIKKMIQEADARDTAINDIANVFGGLLAFSMFSLICAVIYQAGISVLVVKIIFCFASIYLSIKMINVIGHLINPPKK